MTSRSTPRTGPALAKWALGLALVAALIMAARYWHGQEILRHLLERIRQFGPWSPVVFIVLYIVACVLFVPGSLLTLGAGVVFGVVWGSVYVCIAATAGASCAFLIGRYVARDWVAKRISANSRFKAIDEAVAHEGWKIVGLARL